MPSPSRSNTRAGADSAARSRLQGVLETGPVGSRLQAALREAVPMASRLQAALREAGPVGARLEAAVREAGRMGQAALDTAQRIRNGPLKPVPRDWVVIEGEDCVTSSSDDDTKVDQGFENGGDNGGLFDAEPLNIGYVVTHNDGEFDEDSEEGRSGGESWGTYGLESDSEDAYEDAREDARVDNLARRPIPSPVPYSCTPRDRAEAGTITVCVDPACHRGWKPPPTPPPTPIGTADHATPLPSFQIASALIPSSSPAQASSSVARSSSRRPSSSVAGPSNWRASFLARQEAAREGGKAARLASFLGETTEPASKRAKNPPKDNQPNEVQSNKRQPKPKKHHTKEVQPKEHHPKQHQPKENQPKEVQPKENQPEEHQPVLTEHQPTATMPGSWDTTDAHKVEFDRADSALKEKIARVKKDFRGQKRKTGNAAGTAEGDGGGGKTSAGDT